MNYVIIKAVDILFEFIEFMILIRCILSWLPIGENYFTNIVYTLTEPILAPIRNLMNKSPLGGGMMIDFSPVIAFLLLNLISSFLISMLI